MSQDDDTKFMISPRLNFSFISTVLVSAEATPESWLMVVRVLSSADPLESSLSSSSSRVGDVLDEGDDEVGLLRSQPLKDSLTWLTRGGDWCWSALVNCALLAMREGDWSCCQLKGEAELIPDSGEMI